MFMFKNLELIHEKMTKLQLVGGKLFSIKL